MTTFTHVINSINTIIRCNKPILTKVKYLTTEVSKLCMLDKIRLELLKGKKCLYHIPIRGQTANDFLSDMRKPTSCKHSELVESYIDHLRTLSRLNKVDNRVYNNLYFNVNYNDLPRSSKDICLIYGVEYTSAARAIISRIKKKLIAVG